MRLDGGLGERAGARRSRRWRARARRAAAPRARARSARRGRPGSARRGRAATSAKRSSRRRVTDGASSASPRATTRIASTSSAGPHVLEHEAARAGAQGGEDVLVDVVRRQHDDPRRAARGRRSGGSPRARRRSGMRTSISTTSGCSRATSVDRLATVGGLADAPRGPASRRGSCESRRARAPGRRR